MNQAFNTKILRKSLLYSLLEFFFFFPFPVQSDFSIIRQTLFHVSLLYDLLSSGQTWIYQLYSKGIASVWNKIFQVWNDLNGVEWAPITLVLGTGPSLMPSEPAVWVDMSYNELKLLFMSTKHVKPSKTAIKSCLFSYSLLKA